VRSVRVFIK